MAFCPICGSDEKNNMGSGDICTCCFNEVGVQDDKTKEEILYQFCGGDYDLMYEIAPEIREYEMEDPLPIPIVNRFLRLAWIQQGYYHFVKNKIWTKEKGKHQLQNIGITWDKNLEELAAKMAKITRNKNGNMVYSNFKKN